MINLPRKDGSQSKRALKKTLLEALFRPPPVHAWLCGALGREDGGDFEDFWAIAQFSIISLTLDLPASACQFSSSLNQGSKTPTFDLIFRDPLPVPRLPRRNASLGSGGFCVLEAARRHEPITGAEPERVRNQSRRGSGIRPT